MVYFDLFFSYFHEALTAHLSFALSREVPQPVFEKKLPKKLGKLQTGMGIIKALYLFLKICKEKFTLHLIEIENQHIFLYKMTLCKTRNF